MNVGRGPTSAAAHNSSNRFRDVVLGRKYFGRRFAIYTVALLFSLICNLSVLGRLGAPDFGLFLGTYFGLLDGRTGGCSRWVWSRRSLTGNLTVAFHLWAVAFQRARWCFLNVIDGIVRGFVLDPRLAKGWSIGEQMSDFGRGVLSFSSLVYFVMIAVRDALSLHGG